MNGELEVCFEQVSKSWLKAAQSRKRRPMRATSVPSVRCALDKWLLPHLGQLPLAKVHNGTVKHLVAAMQEGGLAPKTINTYTNLVKTIVASHVDEETGEPIYMRKWSATAMDLPVIENQKQPCLTASEIEAMVDGSEEWEKMLYILLAGSGLRISEALGLQREHILNGWRTLEIVQQVGRFGKIVTGNFGAKTKAGIRQVDLHPDVAMVLRAYCQRQRRPSGKSELLFPTREDTPQLPRNLLRVLDRKTDKGFHSFRRFRETHLSEMNANRDIKIFWMGHRPESMSELYSKLSRKTEMRLAEAERVGTGFRLDPHALDQITKGG
jgi:integrase